MYKLYGILTFFTCACLSISDLHFPPHENTLKYSSRQLSTHHTHNVPTLTQQRGNTSWKLCQSESQKKEIAPPPIMAQS